MLCEARKSWWAMTGSNCRPSRCKRLRKLEVIDLQWPSLPKTGDSCSLLRKSAQVLMRKMGGWA